jgi:hypothetical protein
MTMTLYDATIPTYVQIVGAVRGFVARAAEWVDKEGMDEAEIVNARLAEDMLDFAYQVKSVVFHSHGAIECVRAGAASPDMSPPPQSFAALLEMLDATLEKLEALDPADVNALADRKIVFTIPNTEYRLEFSGGDYLLSFVQPNFYFHATTAYAILRAKGMKIGKADFLGQMRIAGA